ADHRKTLAGGGVAILREGGRGGEKGSDGGGKAVETNGLHGELLSGCGSAPLRWAAPTLGSGFGTGAVARCGCTPVVWLPFIAVIGTSAVRSGAASAGSAQPCAAQPFPCPCARAILALDVKAARRTVTQPAAHVAGETMRADGR